MVIVFIVVIHYSCHIILTLVDRGTFGDPYKLDCSQSPEQKDNHLRSSFFLKKNVFCEFEFSFELFFFFSRDLNVESLNEVMSSTVFVYKSTRLDTTFGFSSYCVVEYAMCREGNILGGNITNV